MINSDNSFKLSPLFVLVEILPAYAECEKKAAEDFWPILFLLPLFKTER